MKLNLGSGQSKLEGYTNCDIIAMPGVDVVCSVDKLPFEDNSIEEILAEHLIEHLTFEQFNRTIVEWHRVLRYGGKLTIECPDLLGLCKQFVEANEFGRFQSYRGFWSVIQHIYGHQRGKSEDEKFAQIHKSGYTLEHLMVVLEGVGFGSFEHKQPQRGVPHTPVLRLEARKNNSQPHKMDEEY